MSTLTFEASATGLRFDSENMWIALTDGRYLSIPLAYFPRLLNATPEQREKYEMSGGGTGLHWEEIDEDISVSGLLLGNRDMAFYKKR
jgi:hypothetical protein